MLRRPAASGRIRRGRVRVGAGRRCRGGLAFFGGFAFGLAFLGGAAFGFAFAGLDLAFFGGFAFSLAFFGGFAFGLAFFGGFAFGLAFLGGFAFGLAFLGGAAFGLAFVGGFAFGFAFFSGFAFLFAGLEVFGPVSFDDRPGRLAFRGLRRAESLRDFLLFLTIRCRRRQLTTADKYHIVLCLSQIRGGAPCPLPQTEETLTA